MLSQHRPAQQQQRLRVRGAAWSSAAMCPQVCQNAGDIARGSAAEEDGHRRQGRKEGAALLRPARLPPRADCSAVCCLHDMCCLAAYQGFAPRKLSRGPPAQGAGCCRAGTCGNARGRKSVLTARGAAVATGPEGAGGAAAEGAGRAVCGGDQAAQGARRCAWRPLGQETGPLQSLRTSSASSPGSQDVDEQTCTRVCNPCCHGSVLKVSQAEGGQLRASGVRGCAGVDPKSIVCEFFRHGKCTKGFKCKFAHDLAVERKGGKIDIFSDRCAWRAFTWPAS